MNQAKPGSIYIILILGSLMTVSPFAIDMYLPAFAQIASDFNTTPARVSLSVVSYFIGLAVGQMLYGPLLDRYGRKRPLFIGLLIFCAACVGCMLAPTLEMFIALRFLQAIGGCVAWVAAIAMVRDFFPAKDSAKIYSLLVLILGLSPLLAPTAGGFITASFGWQWVFVALTCIGLLILLITSLFLPEGHQPDTSVSLKAKPMLNTFASILKEPQFYTYTLAGAFSFATLFIYVAGSPVIFMGIFKVSPQNYGILFALLSIGFIGGSQLNILLNRWFSSEKIFMAALTCQLVVGNLFLTGALNDWFGLNAVLILFALCLMCIGLINPNASALALAPFTKNVGSASALIGCIQIGLAGLVSSGVGVLNPDNMVPIVAILTTTTWIAFIILIVGQRRIGKNVLAREEIAAEA